MTNNETPKEENPMTEQLEENTTEVVESKEELIQVELPVLMHRNGKPEIIGSAVVTRYRDRIELASKIDTEGGLDFGSLLTSGYVEGLTLGGILNPSLAAKLK
jgi:hypothetical protein